MNITLYKSEFYPFDSRMRMKLRQMGHSLTMSNFATDRSPQEQEEIDLAWESVGIPADLANLASNAGYEIHPTTSIDGSLDSSLVARPLGVNERLPCILFKDRLAAGIHMRALKRKKVDMSNLSTI